MYKDTINWVIVILTFITIISLFIYANREKPEKYTNVDHQIIESYKIEQISILDELLIDPSLTKKERNQLEVAKRKLYRELTGDVVE